MSANQPDEFDIPIIEVGVKSKKRKGEYKQHMIKLPKKMVSIMQLSDECKLHVKVYPLEGDQKYPRFEIEVMRKSNETQKQS